MTIWKSSAQSPDAEPKPALFLDRDGVVIADENYLADPDKVRLLPGVARALAAAKSQGYLLIGVSNQSGIGRGYFSQEDFHRVMLRLEALLADASVAFDSFHFCPHAPGDVCFCRKPLPGLLDEAIAIHSIDLARSWMIGDKGSDVTFGRAAGMGSILVKTGYGKGEEQGVRDKWTGDPKVLVTDDLPLAIALILEHDDDGSGCGLES